METIRCVLSFKSNDQNHAHTLTNLSLYCTLHPDRMCRFDSTTNLPTAALLHSAQALAMCIVDSFLVRFQAEIK